MYKATLSFLSFNPVHKTSNLWRLCQRAEGVVVPPQLFFSKGFVNHLVTSAAQPQPAVSHVALVKILFEPLVAVISAGNQMMIGEQLLSLTQVTDVSDVLA